MAETLTIKIFSCKECYATAAPSTAARSSEAFLPWPPAGFFSSRRPVPYGWKSTLGGSLTSAETCNRKTWSSQMISTGSVVFPGAFGGRWASFGVVLASVGDRSGLVRGSFEIVWSFGAHVEVVRGSFRGRSEVIGQSFGACSKIF